MQKIQASAICILSKIIAIIFKCHIQKNVDSYSKFMSVEKLLVKLKKPMIINQKNLDYTQKH